MSFTEAFKGAKAELATINAPIDKFKRIATYARIIGAELLSTLQIMPYGIRSHALYRSLPEARLGASHQGSISTARNICYGPRPRNTLDIYLPAEVELDHETLSKAIDSPNIKLQPEMQTQKPSPTLQFQQLAKNSSLLFYFAMEVSGLQVKNGITLPWQHG